jgi:hypothetical protein
MIWASGPSLGAAAFSISRIKLFGRSNSRGSLAGDGFILFVSAGAELKSYMRSGIDLGAVGTATT